MSDILLKTVKPLDGFILEAEFTNGDVRRYDITPLFDEIPVFQAIRDNQELFRSARVIGGGYAVGWNDELDLACEEIWENGIAV